MSPRESLTRIHGLAVSAAVLFAVGAATILVLERIGAPEALVRAAGPILALVGLATVGLGVRSADLASFLAARRGAPDLYGGLALAGLAAGLAACLYPSLASLSDPPALGAAAGVALGCLVVGPLIRRSGATSPNDLVATRFALSPASVVAAIAAWATAALTALAGFQVAVDLTQAALAASRLPAEIAVSTALVMAVTPGGLAGVIWCAAASGGALAMVVALGGTAASTAPAASAGAVPGLLPAAFGLGASAPFVAAALAVAVFFALQPPALAGRDARSALRAGFVGMILCGALIVLALSALPGLALTASAAGVPVAASSLGGAATLSAALVLAGAGVHGSSRAAGVALTSIRKPFPAPASVRLARMRAAQLALVAGCALLDRTGVVMPTNPLVLALALSLAVTAPLVALTAIGRVGPLSASVAALAALGAGVARVVALGRTPGAGEALEIALATAAAAFVAGILTSLVAPRRAGRPPSGAFDPFAGTLPSGEEETARLVVNAPIPGGQNAPAFGRILSVPSRNDAARALDDGSQSDDVVRF
jgi:cation/acetate symporter